MAPQQENNGFIRQVKTLVDGAHANPALAEEAGWKEALAQKLPAELGTNGAKPTEVAEIAQKGIRSDRAGELFKATSDWLKPESLKANGVPENVANALGGAAQGMARNIQSYLGERSDAMVNHWQNPDNKTTVAEAEAMSHALYSHAIRKQFEQAFANVASTAASAGGVPPKTKVAKAGQQI
jgi:hypothetical protein